MNTNNVSLKFFCKRCGKELNLVHGRYSLYYRCDGYEFINRSYNQKACMNRLTYNDFFSLEKKIKDLLLDNVSIKGFEHTFEDKLSFRVLEYNPKKQIVWLQVNKPYRHKDKVWKYYQ